MQNIGGDRAESVDGSGRMRDGGNAQVGVGRGSRLLVRTLPDQAARGGGRFGYSSGALLGAWFGAYVWWAHKIPLIAAIEKQDMWLSPAVILTIGAVMTFVSLWFSPETKDLQLHEVGERERASDRAKGLAGVPDAVFAD